MINKINYWLKWIIVILLIIVAIESVTMKFGHCDKVKVEYQGKMVGAIEIFNVYFEKCFPKKEYNSIDLANLSLMP